MALKTYTRQNNLRVTQWTFQLLVYLVRPMAEIRQDFVKWFLVSKKGVNFYFYNISKSPFLLNFQTIMFYHFYWCLASVLSVVYNDFLILKMVYV